MRPSFRILTFVVGFVTLFPFRLIAQDGSNWRISPEKINIQVGQDRRLQLLDDSAQELHETVWSIDDFTLAEVREADGRAVLHAKGIGIVRVSATVGDQTKSSEIRIWPEAEPLPPGTTNWAVHPIGREIGDLPAVPTGDGPHMYSLEQTANGSSYLRADADDGIQVWAWLMPEKTADVELVCGDWLGGALVSANRADSFTIYAVAKDGQVRWQETIPGLRKGHTLQSRLVYLLSQSADGTASRVTALDEFSGDHKFDLEPPPSSEAFVSSGKDVAESACPTDSPHGTRTFVSRLFGNSDGFAYLAFTQSTRKLSVPECGSPAVPSRQRFLSHDDSLILWQLHPDGTYRTTIIEGSNALSGSATLPVPTGAIIPDGTDGLLLSVHMSRDLDTAGRTVAGDEFIYRIDSDGNLVYKLLLPKYSGSLHDEMVLGQGNRVAFATRGSVLIAFEVQTGKELWRWDSDTPGISVFAALANGDCLVQTSTALVEVHDRANSKELMRSKFIIDWQGRMYRKHN